MEENQKVTISKKERIKNLISSLAENLQEREDIISVALLGSLIEESIFFYGPPGTGKSLIARRISTAFHNQKYFEYLMQKFSTPDEIFGQVSIIELKKDNYKRLTEGFLPTATFAFLDEIWKSSPAILNTLLTILNERTFKNGNSIENCPLRVIISASNEVPPKNQGLEALYDRFLLRVPVFPIKDKNNFEILLESNNVKTETNIKNEYKISLNEVENWKNEINNIKLSKETFNIIHILRTLLFEKAEELDIYVSDRRWKKVAFLLKASAFFCERKETNLSDLLLLKYCLWSTNENREKINTLIENTIKENSYVFKINLSEFDREKEKIEKEINKELYYTENIYDTTIRDGNEYFKTCCIYDGYNRITFLIDKKYIKTNKEFSPVDTNGNILDDIKCNFKGTGSCEIKIKDTTYSHRYYSVDPFSPKILYHKGDKKIDINERLINSLNESAVKLIKDIEDMLKELDSYKDKLKHEVDNPFVPKEDIKILLNNINNLTDDLIVRKFDCEKIKDLAK
jgi:ATPase ravA